MTVFGLSDIWSEKTLIAHTVREDFNRKGEIYGR